MEFKTILFITFAASILGMIFCTNRAGKNVVEDVDSLIEAMPRWQKFLYGLLDVHPYYMLNSKGKKWQTTVYILLIPTLLSGVQIGQLVANK